MKEKNNDSMKWCEKMMGKIKEDFFSAKGRISRSTFGKRMLTMTIIYLTILAVCAIIVFLVLGLSGTGFALYAILMSPIVILYLVLASIQRVKRLHDFDKGGWAITTRGAPFYVDGTVGPNRFGEDPKGRIPDQPAAVQEDEQQY